MRVSVRVRVRVRHRDLKYLRSGPRTPWTPLVVCGVVGGVVVALVIGAVVVVGVRVLPTATFGSKRIILSFCRPNHSLIIFACRPNHSLVIFTFVSRSDR